MELPITLDETVTFGCPWHGRTVDAFEDYIELQAGRQVRCANGGFASTYLFDIGRPDIPSEAIEAQGGAWWGRAILRSRRESRRNYTSNASSSLVYGTGLRRTADGISQIYMPGVPVALRDDDTGTHRVGFARIGLAANQLTVRFEYRGSVKNHSRQLTLTELGQGADQPPISAPILPTIGAEPYTTRDNLYCYAQLLDFVGPRLLLGIVAYSGGGDLTARPPGTESYNHILDGWRPIYSSLVEIEFQAEAFEPALPTDAMFQLRVIEARGEALGNPAYFYQPLPSGSLWAGERIERWEQTSGLITAWYGADGRIESARYDRTQESVQRRWIEQLETDTQAKNQTIARITTIRLLLPSGDSVDEMTMREELLEREAGPSLTLRRSVQVTGQPDDVQQVGPFTAAATWAAPLAIFGPGLHDVNTCVAHLYVTGGVQRIPPQDLRHIWISPCSNKLARLAFSREPYDYPVGSEYLPVFMQLRPLASPQGRVNQQQEETKLHPKGDQQWARSFFYFSAELTAAYNPVTGEVAPSGYSWV